MPQGFEKHKEVNAVFTREAGGSGRALKRTRIEKKQNNTSLTGASRGPPKPYSRTLELNLPASDAKMSSEKSGRNRKQELLSCLEKQP